MNTTRSTHARNDRQSTREAYATHRDVSEMKALQAELLREMAARNMTPADINKFNVRRPNGSDEDRIRALRETLAAVRAS